MPRRSRRRPRPAPGPSFRRNNRIRVSEVRLVDEDGEQVGVVSTDDARKRAREAGLDLVEVAPEARPPVCKILDYGRFKYEVQKKEKRNKAGSSASTLKELRVRPAISPHDLSYRLTDGRKFLEAGHKVLVVCIFKGRQMAHPEHGDDVMRRVAGELGDICRVETAAKLMGRRMSMLLAPSSAAKRGQSKAQKPPRKKTQSEDSAPSQSEAGVSEALAAETPIVETPIVETPIVEAPVVEAPTADAPTEADVPSAPDAPSDS
ncbi:MAG: translation initiation factor IF-3 [Planctomycetota bacterium]|nr:translation initiation factor IF-3 [Planctomycetota bacterium]